MPRLVQVTMLFAFCMLHTACSLFLPAPVSMLHLQDDESTREAIDEARADGIDSFAIIYVYDATPQMVENWHAVPNTSELIVVGVMSDRFADQIVSKPRRPQILNLADAEVSVESWRKLLLCGGIYDYTVSPEDTFVVIDNYPASRQSVTLWLHLAVNMEDVGRLCDALAALDKPPKVFLDVNTDGGSPTWYERALELVASRGLSQLITVYPPHNDS